MGITATDTGGNNIDPIKKGLYPAVLYGLIDIGTQLNTYWNTEQHKVIFIWEIPSERIEVNGEDKPRVISKEYTLSLSEKAHLRNDLKSWRGRDFTAQELFHFDISTVLGANCQVNIIHEVSKKSGKTYAVVSSVVPIGKGTPKLQPENEKLYFSFEDGGEIPENTPDWIKSKIMESREWNENGQEHQEWERREEQNPPPHDDDDIPF